MDCARVLESVNLHERIRLDCERSPLELVSEWTLEKSRLWRLRSPWFEVPLVIRASVLKSADRMRTAALDQAGVLLPEQFDRLWPQLLPLLLGKMIHE